MNNMNILKKLALSFLSIFVLTGTQASAVMLPGWERPIARATLKAVDARGILADVSEAQIVLTKQDGAADVTGIILGFQQAEFELAVSETLVDVCGTATYVATIAPRKTVGISQHWVEVILKDHTNRLDIVDCELDGPREVMKAIVNMTDLLDSEKGQMELKGQMEPVFTVQGAELVY